MGYFAYVIKSDLLIPKKGQDKALTAIKDFIDSENQSRVNFNLAFVDFKLLKQAQSLPSALEAARWLPEIDEEGHIINLEFSGEKLGDEFLLFKAIAPFITSGSYIILLIDNGADAKIWRWLFKNGEVEQQPGEIIFEKIV